MVLARQLLARLETRPGPVDSIDPDTDLTAAGFRSSDVIQLALLIEEYLDAPLEPEELAELSSLRAIDALLARKQVGAAAERD